MKESKINEYHLHKDSPEKRQFEVFSLNEYLKRNTPDTIRPHIHSFYQVLWFIKGRGHHYVDFKKHEVTPTYFSSERTMFITLMIHWITKE